MAEKKKAYTTTTERKNLLENFSGLKEKLSRPVVDTKNPIKPRKTIATTEIFPLWTPFFFLRKEKFCTGAGRCMLSFSQPTLLYKLKNAFVLQSGDQKFREGQPLKIRGFEKGLAGSQSS